MKEQVDCKVTSVNKECVYRVQNELQTKNIPEVSKLFKALADETRMKIAYTLTIQDELCVCDVANMVGATMATASHHLRHLKQLGLAKYRKDGKMVYYSLDDDHVKQLIAIACAHFAELSSR